MPLTSRDHVARALGMLPDEIAEVGERDDMVGGLPVVMTDGTRAVVHDNGLTTVFTAPTVRLSPAAHALNPAVRFADLADAFGHQVVRSDDATAALADLAELVGRDDGTTDPGPVDPPVDPPTPPVEPPPAPVEPPPAPAEVVPDGAAEAVLAWVGRDADRARLALAAEGERPRGPRAGLSASLAAIVAGPEGGAEA